MGFSQYNSTGIKTSTDVLTGDAAQAINGNFITIANALLNTIPATGVSTIAFATGGRVISDENSGVIMEYQNGIHSLYVGANGVYTSGGNVLDDGNGNASISGTLTLPTSTQNPTGVSSGTGGIGTTNYTLGDLVHALKTAGILKA